MANLAVYSQVTSKNIFGESLMNDFINFLDVSPKTIATYQRALRQFFKYLKDNNIQTPTHDNILFFKKSLQDNNRKPATINLYLAAVRKFFIWCEQRGIIQDITHGIKNMKIDSGHKRDFIGANQLNQILSDMPRNTVEEKRNYAIFLLTVTGGLRTIEISRADICDIRLQGDFITLSVQGKGKNSKSDFIKLAPETFKAIQEYLQARKYESESEPLFTSTSNRNLNGRMTTRSISKIIKTQLRKSGYDSPRLSAHSLRHSSVTLSLMAGHTIEETQAFARHSNLNTTLVYNHSVQRLKSTIESDICRAIFNGNIRL